MIKSNFLIYTPSFKHPKYGTIYYDLVKEVWCEKEPTGRGSNSYVGTVAGTILVNGVSIRIPTEKEEIQ